MGIKSIIIDDEKNSRETLKAFLKNYCPEVEVAGEAGSAEEGVTLLQNSCPALVFLDVEMPLGTGFDLLENLEGHDFRVIFTTAHEKYAIKAIRFCALDYLLKPINLSELKAAVSKIHLDSHDNHPRSRNKKQLGIFVDNAQNAHQQHNKIVLPTSDGFEVIEIKEVIRCEADQNYTHFFLTNGHKVLVSRTLKEYEELLSDYNFIRIHQSHLINIIHIQRYIKGRGGYVKMSDDSIIEVSRRKKEELMKRFQG